MMEPITDEGVEEIKIPEKYVCPITGKIMLQPAQIIDTVTYTVFEEIFEKEALEKRIKEDGTHHPITGIAFKNSVRIIDASSFIKNSIDEFVLQYKDTPGNGLEDKIYVPEKERLNIKLFEAVRAGKSIDELKQLILAGADYLAVNDQGNTILHAICFSAAPLEIFNSIKQIILTLDKENNTVDGNQIPTEEEKVAASPSNQETAWIDLCKCTNKYGDTFLHVAAKNKKFDFLYHLAQEMPSLIPIKNKKNQTVLHIVAEYGVQAVGAVLVLMNSGASIDQKDNNQMTPVMCADKKLKHIMLVLKQQQEEKKALKQKSERFKKESENFKKQCEKAVLYLEESKEKNIQQNKEIESLSDIKQSLNKASDDLKEREKKKYQQLLEHYQQQKQHIMTMKKGNIELKLKYDNLLKKEDDKSAIGELLQGAYTENDALRTEIKNVKATNQKLRNNINQRIKQAKRVSSQSDVQKDKLSELEKNKEKSEQQIRKLEEEINLLKEALAKKTLEIKKLTQKQEKEIKSDFWKQEKKVANDEQDGISDELKGKIDLALERILIDGDFKILEPCMKRSKLLSLRYIKKGIINKNWLKSYYLKDYRYKPKKEWAEKYVNLVIEIDEVKNGWQCTIKNSKEGHEEFEAYFLIGSPHFLKECYWITEEGIELKYENVRYSKLLWDSEDEQFMYCNFYETGDFCPKNLKDQYKPIEIESILIGGTKVGLVANTIKFNAFLEELSKAEKKCLQYEEVSPSSTTVLSKK